MAGERMRIKDSQDGFAALLVLLIVLILAFLGGLYIWKNKFLFGFGEQK